MSERILIFSYNLFALAFKLIELHKKIPPIVNKTVGVGWDYEIFTTNTLLLLRVD